MNVVASFKLNKNLDSAIAELEHFGIDRNNILALPLATMAEREIIVSKQKQLYETAPILGTIFMLLGTIYGYILPLGPILFGLTGLVTGMITGGFIDFVRVKRSNHKSIEDDGIVTEVFLLVHCFDNAQALMVREKLWKHIPNGVTTFTTDIDRKA